MEGQAEVEDLPGAAQATRADFFGGALFQLLRVLEAPFRDASRS